MLIDKIDIVEKRYDEIYQMIGNPEIIADHKKYVELNKELKDLSKLVDKGRLYKDAIDQKKEAEEYLNSSDDNEMIDMAKEQLEISKESINNLEEEIKIMLIPKDPNDSKNVVVEIRAGTGGDEASIFAGDLYRMYSKFAQDKKWKISLVDTSEGTAGGFKEIIFEIAGDDVYGILKYESGVHRVQRVPQTETQGRVHTSAATVMVLPEAEEFDVEINMGEVRVDYFCSSGPGGQSVNTTYSAVRLTHEPTGIVVQCQSGRSQHRNKEEAMKQLRARLYELELNKKEEELQSLEDSKSDIGWGSQIRSYVLDSSRIKDLRTGVETSNCNSVLDGDINLFIEASLKEGI